MAKSHGSPWCRPPSLPSCFATTIWASSTCWKPICCLEAAGGAGKGALSMTKSGWLNMEKTMETWWFKPWFNLATWCLKHDQSISRLASQGSSARCLSQAISVTCLSKNFKPIGYNHSPTSFKHNILLLEHLNGMHPFHVGHPIPELRKKPIGKNVNFAGKIISFSRVSMDKYITKSLSSSKTLSSY